MLEFRYVSIVDNNDDQYLKADSVLQYPYIQLFATLTNELKCL